MLIHRCSRALFAIPSQCTVHCLSRTAHPGTSHLVRELACSLIPCQRSSASLLHGQRRACCAAAAHDQFAAAAPEQDPPSSGSWGQRVLGSLKPPEVLQPGLYVVGTPIGNLEDVTLRALRVLRDADLLLAEDTRHTRKLLSHFSIGAGRLLLSFHAHNEHERQAQVLEMLRGGAAVALVSDAGMPAVSDPGAMLVAAAVKLGITVVPVPGPSAVLAALVGSGLATDAFQFAGFLPAKSGQRLKRLEQLADVSVTLVFYVPPHSLDAVLADMAAVFTGTRQCVIAREITKVHEEFYRGTLTEAAAEFSARQCKGEVTIVVEGFVTASTQASAEDIEQHLSKLLHEGHSPSQAARMAAKALGVPRNDAYDAAVRLGKG